MGWFKNVATKAKLASFSLAFAKVETNLVSAKVDLVGAKPDLA